MKILRVFISFALLCVSTAVFANDMNIAHTPRESARAGERVRLRLKVDQPEKVDLVRLYFKSDLNAKFNFVNTRQLGKYIFAAQLPAATKDAKSIEYVFVIRDKSSKVIKTQKFNYPIKGEIPLVASKRPVKVFSELKKAPKSIEGFDDNIEMDVAESGAKLAAVAGLYEVEAAVAATSTSSSSTTTTAAVGGGVSTTTLIAAGVGGATVVGVAAGGGGGGGDSSPQVEAYTIIEFQSAQYSGTYRWDCQDEINQGSTDIVLDLDETSGTISGTAQYLGSSIPLSGSYEQSTGALNFELQGTGTIAANTFVGTFNPDNPTEKISGTMEFGENGANEGCTTGGIAPAGTLTAY